ncbi:hypothetical protein Hanom_Chr03g00256271 [Helianthus anomalus]
MCACRLLASYAVRVVTCYSIKQTYKKSNSHCSNNLCNHLISKPKNMGSNITTHICTYLS